MASGPVSSQVLQDGPTNVPKAKKGNGSTASRKGSENTASNSSGLVDADVEMEGVAVINGDVFIDGEKVQRGKTLYTAKKSGKSYRIQWGKNGNVSVEEN